jgi:hypothetical protein
MLDLRICEPQQAIPYLQRTSISSSTRTRTSQFVSTNSHAHIMRSYRMFLNGLGKSIGEALLVWFEIERIGEQLARWLADGIVNRSSNGVEVLRNCKSTEAW